MSLKSSNIDSEQDINLIAGNDIELLASKDIDSRTYKKEKKDTFTFTNRDQGHFKETIVTNELELGGNLSIVANNAILAEHKEGESFKLFISVRSIMEMI